MTEQQLRLEVLKIATDSQFSGGNATRAAEVAATFWEFVCGWSSDGLAAHSEPAPRSDTQRKCPEPTSDLLSEAALERECNETVETRPAQVSDHP
jgi:hypothetical protein